IGLLLFPRRSKADLETIAVQGINRTAGRCGRVFRVVDIDVSGMAACGEAEQPAPFAPVILEPTNLTALDGYLQVAVVALDQDVAADDCPVSVQSSWAWRYLAVLGPGGDEQGGNQCGWQLALHDSSIRRSCRFRQRLPIGIHELIVIFQRIDADRR